MAGDAGAAPRVLWRGNAGTAAGDRDARGVEPEPDVRQLGAGLPAQPPRMRMAKHGVPARVVCA